MHFHNRKGRFAPDPELWQTLAEGNMLRCIGMVISVDMFNYRKALKQDTLRKHAFPGYLIQRWKKVEDGFRRAIVKAEPVPRKIGNLERLFAEYSSTPLELTSLCDSCDFEIPCSTINHYHRCTGKLQCDNCFSHSDRINLKLANN